MQKYPKGSEWRKWDLQVQTITDDNYKSINTYYEELKKTYPTKWEELCKKVGSEDLVIKYDSKYYFFSDTVDNEKKRAKNYANIFLTFLDIFNSDTGAVCITDHNYEHPYLIDSLLKESVNTKTKIIPGVEINVQGIHFIVLFGEIPYEKSSYSEGIKTFLSKINIDNKKTNSKLTVSDKSYTDVIDEINTIGAIFIYPHCNSTKGLFQERGKTDRTHLADQFNYVDFNILQSKNNSSVTKTEEYILGNDQLKSNFAFTLGSDARSLIDTFKPDKSGNFCWIKVDPTFEGLKQIIYEPEDRVFIGKKPELLVRVISNRTRFIKSIEVIHEEGYDESKGIWFKNIKVPINYGMVAIIGNKGSGKSALTDIIGLCGNSHHYNDFSFLNKKRFLKNNLARHFKANLEWASGEITPKNLLSDVDYNAPERIRYLPQNFFERLTNNLDNYDFQKTLEDIVFSYLPEVEKLGKNSFEELIRYKKEGINKDVELIIDEIDKINEELIELENKMHPAYKDKLVKELAIKKKELEEHLKNKPPEVKNPELDKDTQEYNKEISDQINDKNKIIEELISNISQKKDRVVILKQEIEELDVFNRDFVRFENEIKTFLSTKKEALKKYNLNVNKLLKYEIDLSELNKVIEKKKKEFKDTSKVVLSANEIETKYSLEERTQLILNSLIVKLDVLEKDIAKLKGKLSEPYKKYQDYLENLKKWENNKLSIEGKEDLPQTINWYKNEIKYIDNELLILINKKRELHIEKAIDILNKKLELLDIYNKLKTSVDGEINDYKQILGDYDINIDVALKLMTNFIKEFLSYINQNKKGSFFQIDDGRKRIEELITSYNIQSKEGITEFLKAIINNLENDKRTKFNNESRYISEQINDNKLPSFYNYLFSISYLEPSYELKLGDKQLTELSPGEKGAMLIVFYLMLYKDNIPLIIDQPEENLDNESIYKILVHFIRETKKRRQVIIITHNPNLAIVGDAEQIIYVTIDKKNKNKFSYNSGSIENPVINKHASDILEGTLKAFDIRRLKYYR
ncbi:MAG: hypothetical protein HQ534_06770 [Armatimonadetes bacterium]|nr:hypothetical protein [Armatimonadota bacterium]